MKNLRRRPLALVAMAGALAFPALATAERPSDRGPKAKDRHAEQRHNADRGKRGERRAHSHSRAVAWNVKGVVTATGEDTVTLLVQRSNRHARALRDTEVTFDVSNARIVVRDVDGDGDRNLADVAEGDLAKIKARLSRAHVFGDAPAPARRGIFKAPQVDEEGEEEEQVDEQE